MSNLAYLTRKCENFRKEKNDPQMKVSTGNHVEPCSFNSNSGDEMQDWQAMKLEIDNLFQDCKEASVLLQKDREVSEYWDKIRAQMRNR